MKAAGVQEAIRRAAPASQVEVERAKQRLRQKVAEVRPEFVRDSNALRDPLELTLVPIL